MFSDLNYLTFLASSFSTPSLPVGWDVKQNKLHLLQYQMYYVITLASIILVLTLMFNIALMSNNGSFSDALYEWMQFLYFLII